MNRIILLLVCAVLLPLLAGCGTDNARNNPKIEPPARLETGVSEAAAIIKTVTPLTLVPTQAADKEPLPTLSAIKGSTPEGLSWQKDFQVQRAVDDLASRLKLEAGEVSVVAVIEQDFSRQGFSCVSSKERIGREAPEQNITGRTILLEAAGRRFEYHAGEDTVFFCRSIN